MKRTASLVMASALIICTFGSCSSKNSIVGKWEMQDLSDTEVKVGGLEFKDNGKGSMFMDTTSILHAEDKGIVVGSGEQAFKFEEDLINYDGKALDINIQGQDIITLERIDGKNSTDNYNGEFELKSGVMYDTIVEGIKKNASGGEDQDLTVHISFDGSNSEVTFVDIFDYKAEKGRLEISGYASFIGESSDGKAVNADFEIKDDVLKVTSAEGETEELVKVKK